MSGTGQVIKYIALALAIVLVAAIIGGMVGGLSLLSKIFDGSDDPITDMRQYAVEGNATSLDIDVDASEIKILIGDAFYVKSNLKDIAVNNDGGTLAVKYKTRFNVYSGEAVIEICVPADTVFKSITVSSGAGMMYAKALCADRISIDSGAGKVDIDGICAKKQCDINTGAGKVSITDADINDLDLDIGTGRLELAGILFGDCNIDMGVGAADIILQGGKDAYRFDVDKGIGDITVDGISVSDGAAVGDGDCRVNISGGIGALTVSFE